MVKVDFDELTTRQAPWLSPGELAKHNSVGKARSVQDQYPQSFILAADTVVALGNRIFEKPADNREASLFLQALSGQTHCVLTSLTLAIPQRGLRTELTSTLVTFRRLSATQIKQYLKQVHVLDKAGGYAIQEQADTIIQSIDGSLSNVIGLPIETLAEMLQQLQG